jgi:hypothetical protein
MSALWTGIVSEVRNASIHQSRIGGIKPGAIAGTPLLQSAASGLPALPASRHFLLLSLQLTRFVHADAEALFQTGCRRRLMALMFHDSAS